MKTKRILAILMALVMILLSFAACTAKTAGDETTEAVSENDTELESVTVDPNATNVSFLKGPTGMGGAYMMSQSEKGATQGKYNFTLDTDATVVGPKLMKGEYDIAAIPTNLAASLYNKSAGKVKVLAVNTLGVLYIVAKDNAVTSVADLKGKTILTSGKGTVAEYALNYVLEQNGLKVGEDVTIEFTTEHSESVTKALAGGYDIVMLPEPFVTQLTVKDSSFKIAVNLTDEWEKAGNCTLTMGCIAVNTAFYEKNPEAVANFITDYKASVEYVNNNIDEASALIEQLGIVAKAAVAKKAIPNCNIVCYTDAEMTTALESFYNVLFAQNPAAIGGNMPASDFYINAAG